MSREWKPGDVAMLGGSVVALFVRTGEISNAPAFIAASGDEMSGAAWPEARPLLLIDPEDREQVDRLFKAWLAHPVTHNVNRLQSALRSLLTPPKPDEPTGLGAVVEERGARWSHIGNGWWAQATRGPGQTPAISHRLWSEFTSVAVLSEGVQP